MTGILVTGHGHFPTGLLSAVSLVAGKPELTEAVDFPERMTSAELEKALEAALDGLEAENVLILADLVGGTPFNTAAALRARRRDRRIQVVAGVNMPAMVEAVFSRQMYGPEELADDLIKTGRDGFVSLDQMESGEEEPEFEDGL